MHYEENKKVTQVQRCDECKTIFKLSDKRYVCCNYYVTACVKCEKVRCRLCGEYDQRYGFLVYSCFRRDCKKKYDVQDMFFDSKTGYYICPTCFILMDYRMAYDTAVDLNIMPKKIIIMTGSCYSLEELTNYFKNWCFYCTNRIGEKDAVLLKKGARICHSCISIDIDVVRSIIKCLSCQKYIHSQKEIFKVVGSETEVMCINCASKQKLEPKLIDSNGGKCVLCLNSKAQFYMTECMHLISCKGCEIILRQQKKCPLCRKESNYQVLEQAKQ